jgi:hypothetical protein
MSLDRYLQRVKVNGARKGLFTLSVTLAFTLATGQVSEREEVAYGTTTNLAARKTPCWAGGRPHFCTGSRAQSDSWVAPAQQEASFGARVRGKNLGEAGEEGRNYLLHLCLHHLLQLGMRINLGKTRK